MVLIYFIVSDYVNALFAMTQSKEQAMDLWGKYALRYAREHVCIHEYEQKPDGSLVWLSKMYDEKNPLLPFTQEDLSLIDEILKHRNPVYESDSE